MNCRIFNPRLAGTLVALVILSIILINNPPNVAPSSSASIDNLSINQDFSSGSFLYPSSDYVYFEDSDRLADFIADRLELQEPLRIDDMSLISPNDLDLLNANQTKARAADLLITAFDESEYPELFYISVKYTCGSVSIYLFYDNLNESGRLFRAFEIDFRDGLVVNSTDVIGSSIELMIILDIPYTDCEMRVTNLSTTIIPVNDDTYDDVTTLNETRVIFHTMISGLDFCAGNNVGIKFDDEGRMMRFQCGAFFDIQCEFAIESDTAIELAHSEVYDYIDDPEHDVVVGEWISDIRLFPTAVPMDGNISDREIHVVYTYVAYLLDEYHGSINWHFMLIDVDTGELIKSVMAIPAAYEGTRPPQDATIAQPLAIEFLIPVLISGILLAVIFIGPIELSYPVLTVLVIPLYLRIKKSKVLDNFNRGRIYQFISANPGTSYSEMKSALGIPNGCISYHLGILEKSEIIRIVLDGKTKRHYVVGVPNHSLFAFLSATQSKIVDVLHAYGPMTTSQIAAELSISRQRTHHNLKKLSDRGILQSTDSGWVIMVGYNEPSG